LGWNYYSERCLSYLTGGNTKFSAIFRWVYIFAVFIGPYLTVSAVWTIADIFNGLMAFPNIIALILLSPVVFKETKSYFARLAAGEIDEYPTASLAEASLDED
jgi:AGCS family alanine or glycine:cation symporter